MDMNCAVKAYEGQEPYLFVSYAHDDAHLVYPIVERLVMDGYRIWYDDGIHAGEDWTDKVASRLDGSSICVAMLTENYVRSINCRNEMAYSLNARKNLIAVKLTEFDMPGGLRLQLGNTLYLERYSYGETEFFERFDLSHGVSTCRAESPRITDSELVAWRQRWTNAIPIRRARPEAEKVKLHAPSVTPTPAVGKRKSPLVPIAAALIVFAAIVAVALVTSRGKAQSPAVSESAVTAETAEPTAEPEPTVEPTATPVPTPIRMQGREMEITVVDNEVGAIQNITAQLLGSGKTAQLEIGIEWQENMEVTELFGMALQTEPFRPDAIMNFMRNFYSMTGSPLLSGGSPEQIQYGYYGQIPAVGPFHVLLLCFDTNGQVVGYITVEVNYPAEG